MDFLTSILGAVFSGGATGLIGVAMNGFAKFKEAKEANRHTEQMETLSITAMEKEAALEIQKVETEADAAIQIKASEAFAASYDHDKASYSVGWKDRFKGGFGNFLANIIAFGLGMVDILRGLIRPWGTIYMVSVTSYILFELLKELGGLKEALDADQKYALVQHLIHTITYLATTSYTWWFGIRQMNK